MTQTSSQKQISQDVVDGMIADIGKQIGIDGLAFGPSDDVTLRIENRFDVRLMFFPGRNALMATTLVEQVSAFTSDELERLFAINLDWEQTGNGIFSVLPDTDMVGFAQMIDVSHGDSDTLSQSLVEYITSAAQILTFVENKDAPDAAPTPEDVVIFR